MGELAALQALPRSSREMSDAAVLAVINPPAADRNRNPGNVSLPGHAAWRQSTPIGAPLDPTQHQVVTNHFRVDTSRIAGSIVHHHVHIFRVMPDGSRADRDSTVDGDQLANVALVLKLFTRHPEWSARGYSYDGKSALFTSGPLGLPAQNAERQPFLSESIGLPSLEGVESTRLRFLVELTQVDVIPSPPHGAEEWRNLDPRTLRALDTALTTFARNQSVHENPAWALVGQKVFSAKAPSYDLIGPYLARRGYYAAMKCCLAGLTVVVDMSVNSFLASGPILTVMQGAANYQHAASFQQDAARGFPPKLLAVIEKAIKNAKVRLVHLGHTKKVVGLGPAADSEASKFDMEEGGRKKRVTVAEYFEIMARQKANYRNALQNGRLRYPKMPTLNVGSKTKPVLVPAELVVVLAGQSRAQSVDAEMVAKLIRYSAVRPEERMSAIMLGDGGESVVSVLRSDADCQKFGLDGVAPQPLTSPAFLLPPAKLAYGGGKIVDPGLAGSWNIDRPQQLFAKLPPAAAAAGFMFGVLLAGDRPPPGEPAYWQGKVSDYMADIVRDAAGSGLKLNRGGSPLISRSDHAELRRQLEVMKRGGVRIVLVVLIDACYADVKLVADGLGLVTQCALWKNVERPPRGFHLNVVLKICTKLGGTCHTLASRLPAGAAKPSTFQDPPASLSWIFDKPAMLVGIDVSHPEPGSEKPSMAAVVASMDGRCSQYAAYLTTLPSRQEMVATLQDAMVQLLQVFRQRNANRLPATIIVYRDGVSDGQFQKVLTDELPFIHGALELSGVPVGGVKVSIVVCQKRHHTRLFYKDQAGGGEFINPCPGLVLDSRGRDSAITSATLNEFYLNSHTAIQGTAKPCKYALIYDEVGFKLSELELLTYWTTYLYARCNRSVSYATPAYYAHWASQRCKELFSAGCTDAELRDISNLWTAAGMHSTMFFI